MAQPGTSATETSARSTASRDLDRAVAELQDHVREFARLGPEVKARLLRSCLPRAVEVAGAWSARGLEAKGLSSTSAEEWLAGPVPVVRHLRLLAESLDAVAAAGRPAPGTGVRRRDDGRLEVALFPASALERVLYRGTSASALLQEGLDPEDARARQAGFYAERDPDGAVCLVLGAGNVSSIPAMDVLTKLFNEGQVCLLKVNPVNEWAGPFVERALAPLVDAGFLRVVYGGADGGGTWSGTPGSTPSTSPAPPRPTMRWSGARPVPSRTGVGPRTTRSCGSPSPPSSATSPRSPSCRTGTGRPTSVSRPGTWPRWWPTTPRSTASRRRC